MVANAVARFENVVKEYPLDFFGRRKLQALRGVSLTINSGEVFALLGPNRAGKTTLVKILLSLVRLTSGTVERLGQPLLNRSTLARVGYVHENHAFPRYLTPARLLEYYGSLTLLPEAEVKKRVPVLLEKVALADRKDDTISGFSKGMLQRLGVAQALINEPELLVFDEPNEGLDLYGKELVTSIIREWRKAGRTIILISHALHEVEQLADRAAVLLNGSLAFYGKLEDLKKGQSLETALHKLYEQPRQTEK